MPIYEYQCEKCDVEFERLQRADDEFPSCPLCGGSVDKLISSPGALVVKGDSAYPAGGTCCGEANPCESPKKCCGKH